MLLTTSVTKVTMPTVSSVNRYGPDADTGLSLVLVTVHEAQALVVALEIVLVLYKETKTTCRHGRGTDPFQAMQTPWQ